MAEQGLAIDVVMEDAAWEGVEAALVRALEAAGAAESKSERGSGRVALLLTNDAAVRRLNHDWRGKDAPTNVLSFPAAPNWDNHLGDIALGAETIAREAQEQGKSFEAHACHLAVHGLLHLLGYDHETEAEAEIMEGRERAIMTQLGLADPYAVRA